MELKDLTLSVGEKAHISFHKRRREKRLRWGDSRGKNQGTCKPGGKSFSSDEKNEIVQVPIDTNTPLIIVYEKIFI